MAKRRGRPAGHVDSVLLATAATVLVAGGLALLVTLPDRSDDAADASSRTTPSRTARVSEPAPRPTLRVQQAGSKRSPSRPVRGRVPEAIVVPALDVDADVSAIATVDGVLTPPADPQEVGWWNGGARPGSSAGAAVFTGHTVRTGGGAFDDLEALAAGDEVTVRSAGRPVLYEVTSTRILSREELAADNARIFGRKGAPRLVLITCEDWDGTAYRSNVVVTAEPAS